MLGFLDFLTESIENFIGDADEAKKHAHKQEVFDMIQKAYAKVGGIQGNGFKSPDDMVKNVPFWKIHKKNGKVIAAKLYKDKNGRKGVAMATDGTEEGKAAAGGMIREELKQRRSWGEQSASALSFSKKMAGGDLRPHVIPYHVAKTLHDDEIRPAPKDDPEVVRHPELAKHFYQRQIGGHWHTKIAIGTPAKPITDKEPKKGTKDR